MFNLLKNLQSVFILTPTLDIPTSKGANFSTPSPTRVCVCVCIRANLETVKYYLIAVLMFISLKTTDD